MRVSRHIPVVASAIAVALVHAPAVLAADAEMAEAPQVLSPMRVRADFRHADILDSSASVTVLDQTAIQDAGQQHFESLTQLVPNLNSAGGTSRARYFQIRGIGELEQYQGAPNPSVGFLIDDIDFSGVGGVATLFDTEQIDVLRGPQGTRYGANALAGMIYVKSVDPTPEFDLTAEALAGSDSARSAGVAFGGPVTDSLGYRLVAHRYQSDGQRNNRFYGDADTNQRDETTLRNKWRFVGNGLRADLTAMYVDIDNGYDAWAIDSSRDTLSDDPGEDSQQSLAGSLRLVADIGDAIELVSISSAADSDIRFSFDGDWGNDQSWGEFGPYDFFSDTERNRTTISQELRLQSRPGHGLFAGRSEWLVGVYTGYLDENNAILDEFNGAVFRELDSDYDATNAAVFVQLDTRLAARTSLSAGIRGERRWADYQDSDGADFDPTDTMPGGHVTLSFTPRENVNLYGSVSRGYKAGGFNIGAVVPEERREYDPEYLWNYEVGFKGLWPARGVFASLALFYQDRDDAQVSTSFQLDPNDPLSFVFLTDNAAEGHNFGLEGEARWRIHRNWTVQGSLGLLQTEFDDYQTPNRSLDGRDQAHAPHYMYDLGITYRDQRGFFGRVDVSGKDAFYYSDSHDQKSDSYTVVNAKVGFEALRWSAFVWGRNVFDEEYSLHGFFFANEPPDWQEKLYEQQADPAQFGLTFTYRY